MSKRTHLRPADVRGYSRLAIDATLGLTRLVETMHHNIARIPGPLGKYTQEPTRGITGLIYRTIQGTTKGECSPCAQGISDKPSASLAGSAAKA